MNVTFAKHAIHQIITNQIVLIMINHGFINDDEFVKAYLRDDTWNYFQINCSKTNGMRPAATEKQTKMSEVT